MWPWGLGWKALQCPYLHVCTECFIQALQITLFASTRDSVHDSTHCHYDYQLVCKAVDRAVEAWGREGHSPRDSWAFALLRSSLASAGTLNICLLLKCAVRCGASHDRFALLLDKLPKSGPILILSGFLDVWKHFLWLSMLLDL